MVFCLDKEERNLVFVIHYVNLRCWHKIKQRVMEYCSDLNRNGTRSGDGVQIPGELINGGVNSTPLPLLKQLFCAIPRAPTPPPFLSGAEHQPGQGQLALCGTGDKCSYGFVEAHVSGTLSTRTGVGRR